MTSSLLSPLRASIARDLPGCVTIPDAPVGLVLFAQTRGCGDRAAIVLADGLNRRGLATYLFDLLRPEEADDPERCGDVDLLAARIADAIAWSERRPEVARLPLGLLGVGTGVAAALIAAAADPRRVRAIVSCAGRPDLAPAALPRVASPTSFIVGGDDHETLTVTFLTRRRMACLSEIVVVPGAGADFAEHGALDAVAAAAGDWFVRHLRHL